MPNDVQRAATTVARLRAHGKTPTPEGELRARQDLAYAKVRREIAEATCSRFRPGHVGHLVALLVAGNDSEAVERFENAVREGAYGLTALTPADRARIAQRLIDGGVQ